ncbi:L,D-transpeptidase [Paenibacillus campi]|uniref:L,D-transpeptidase n=1 Tax=Paenibacillus campi TaxID=3106031 RepID=UPI002AFF9D6F|nr:L,D-transpeptidase [Paenibacillus sp. SGZ-1009]
MKNLLYLKRYVKMHPDNRMGWYLLGKEYDADGQIGKANYCYNRAGDVYEAFEQSQIPAEVLKDYEAKVMEMGHARERKVHKRRLVWFGLVLLFLFMMRSVGLPAASDQIAMDAAPGAATNSAVNGGNNGVQQTVQLPAYHAPLSFTAASGGSTAAGNGLALYMAQQSNGTEPERVAILGMEKSGNWELWKHVLPVAYTMEAAEMPAQVQVQSYNAAACRCQPAASGIRAAAAAEWMQQQEQLAVMQTALASFKAARGQLPAGLMQLDQSFPSNWLSGTTETMDQSFRTLQPYPLDHTQAMPENGFSGEMQKLFASTLGNRPYFSEPLEIIVDKKRHRLGLVSGTKLLRNYPVGLGGTKTPEGVFHLSIKVMNPNGKSSGEFGSRGMQLSDTNYAIHGTNEPNSIGADESLGCVRMNKDDIEELFDMAPLGTKVTIASDVLPDETQIPSKRYVSDKKPQQDQTDPSRTYHWLH